MTQILSGKEYAQELKQKLITLGQQGYWSDRYIAILFFGDNEGSRVYTSLKKQFGQDIGLEVRILGQEKEYAVEDVLDLINELNRDKECAGIMVQLPLPDHLMSGKGEILSRIMPEKDVDGLGGEAFGKAVLLGEDFMPATPAAIVGLMDYHGIGNVQGKVVTILGQSLLIGSPLATVLMQRGATVLSCNEYTSKKLLKEFTQQADIVISCTGVVHLVDETYVRHDNSQIIIDVGYGKKDGKAVGDVQTDNVKGFVSAYMPSPGGVGPATIGNLFTNIVRLQKLFYDHTN